jgi:hypothetical protein
MDWIAHWDVSHGLIHFGDITRGKLVYLRVVFDSLQSVRVSQEVMSLLVTSCQLVCAYAFLMLALDELSADVQTEQTTKIN